MTAKLNEQCARDDDLGPALVSIIAKTRVHWAMLAGSLPHARGGHASASVTRRSPGRRDGVRGRPHGEHDLMTVAQAEGWRSASPTGTGASTSWPQSGPPLPARGASRW